MWRKLSRNGWEDEWRTTAAVERMFPWESGWLQFQRGCCGSGLEDWWGVMYTCVVDRGQRPLMWLAVWVARQKRRRRVVSRHCLPVCRRLSMVSCVAGVGVANDFSAIFICFVIFTCHILVYCLNCHKFQRFYLFPALITWTNCVINVDFIITCLTNISTRSWCLFFIVQPQLC